MVKHRSAMAELCRFYGIVIRMYPLDHAPPHFHAVYGEYEASIGIEDLATVRGALPRRARRLVAEWALLHQAELRRAWQQAWRLEPPGTIAPLE